MKVAGVGVDIVELSRVRGIASLARFAEFFLTTSELLELSQRGDTIEFVASRFAAKEAVIKAHPMSLTPLEFEIRKVGHKPVVYFFNPAHRTCMVDVSLSHSTEYAAGYAVAHAV